MKTNHLFRNAAFLILFTIAAVGCKKDDDTASIIGSWEVRSYHEVTTDLSTTPPTTSTYDTTFAPGTGAWVEFRADNTFITKSYAAGPQTNSGTYSYANNQLSTKDSGSGATDTEHVVVTGSTLTFSDNDTTGSVRDQLTITFARL